jgi:hypothetical protein
MLLSKAIAANRSELSPNDEKNWAASMVLNPRFIDLFVLCNPEKIKFNVQ